MQITPIRTATTIQEVRQEAILKLAAVLQMLQRRSDPRDHLETVRSLLESLPLSTGEYGMAQNRLRNAERYLRSQEHGAARFELQMLAGSLRNGNAV
jgi:hypothetical protein